jgi:ABC-type nickel/cobalt efflux system permease component RcnA
MSPIPMEYLFYALEAVAALLVIGVGFFIWKQLRQSHHQRHAQKLIESLDVKQLRNLVFPDGVDGLVFIDYLLLSPKGFVVLDLEHVEGHLFGGKSVDQWSQVTNNKTYKFNNPLYANQTKCQALSWNIQQQATAKHNREWEVRGWIAFTNAGNFPKGIPAQVSMVDTLKTSLNEFINSDQPISDELNKTWEALHSLSISTQTENAR